MMSGVVGHLLNWQQVLPFLVNTIILCYHIYSVHLSHCDMTRPGPSHSSSRIEPYFRETTLGSYPEVMCIANSAKSLSLSLTSTESLDKAVI